MKPSKTGYGGGPLHHRVYPASDSLIKKINRNPAIAPPKWPCQAISAPKSDGPHKTRGI